VADLDHADHSQRPQGFAQQSAGNAELQRQPALGRESVAGTNAAGEELIAEKAQHAVETAADRFLRGRFSFSFT
jgi:hypothetical protein